MKWMTLNNPNTPLAERYLNRCKNIWSVRLFHLRTLRLAQWLFLCSIMITLSTSEFGSSRVTCNSFLLVRDYSQITSAKKYIHFTFYVRSVQILFLSITVNLQSSNKRRGRLWNFEDFREEIYWRTVFKKAARISIFRFHASTN